MPLVRVGNIDGKREDVTEGYEMQHEQQRSRPKSPDDLPRKSPKESTKACQSDSDSKYEQHALARRMNYLVTTTRGLTRDSSNFGRALMTNRSVDESRDIFLVAMNSTLPMLEMESAFL